MYPLLKPEPLLLCSLGLKLMGVLTSAVLVLKSIDISNSLLNRLCFAGPGSDCNQVIFSAYGKITDELSWAEAGLLYFCGTFLTMLFTLAWPGINAYFFLLALLSSLYIFHSLYLQAFVLKQWCLLCILTLVILCLDVICLVQFFQWPLPLLPVNIIFKLGACFGFVVLAWVAIKPGLKASRILVSTNTKLRDIKGRNIRLFRALMAGQPFLDIPPQAITIMEGKPSAPITITVVSKPYCEACGEAHRELASWLEVRDDIQVQLVFYVLNYEGDAETDIATYLMQIYRQSGPEQAKKALGEWFASKSKDLDNLKRGYPLAQMVNVSTDLKHQQQWCLINDISVTPMILINGRQLPAFYKPEEVKYFI